ncbi:MAG: hypothetical protein ACO3JL_08060 [Myxococcota bacterium]
MRAWRDRASAHSESPHGEGNNVDAKREGEATPSDVRGSLPSQVRETSNGDRAIGPAVDAMRALSDDERRRLGFDGSGRLSHPAGATVRPAGVVSPLAAARFSMPVVDAPGSPRADMGTRGEGRTDERPPIGWLQERVFRPANYVFLRAMGRLPATQTHIAALADVDATVLRKRTLGGGINGSFVLELSNGAKGVWKPSAAEHMKQMRDCIEGDHQARREAAAYLVDVWLGHLAQVPPTVYREVEGEAGALMAFVEGRPAGSERHAPNRPPRRSDGPEFDDYRHIAIFDHVIGNLDRHSGNWLVKDDGSLVPIDHGIAFPLHNGAPGHHKFAFNRPLQLRETELAALQHLLDHRVEVEAQLGPLLAKEAVSAMFERVGVMVAKGTTDHAWRAYGHPLEQRMLEGVPFAV